MTPRKRPAGPHSAGRHRQPIHAPPAPATKGSVSHTNTTKIQPAQRSFSFGPRGCTLGERPMRCRTRRAWRNTPTQYTTAEAKTTARLIQKSELSIGSRSAQQPLEFKHPVLLDAVPNIRSPEHMGAIRVESHVKLRFFGFPGA